MDLEKEVAKAQKRLAKLINDLATDARVDTGLAFAKLREELKQKEGK